MASVNSTDAAAPNGQSRASKNCDLMILPTSKLREPPKIKGSGYVVRSLEAALWAFHHTSSFSEGALRVVNLGDDADTTGAIYGQVAGAYYGYEGIPAAWRSRIAIVSAQAKTSIPPVCRPPGNRRSCARSSIVRCRACCLTCCADEKRQRRDKVPRA